MMSSKFLIRPDRLRQIPPRFSWIDQRLVRDAHLRRLSHGAGMLYLFLVSVADRHGVSWYSSRRICVELNMGEEQLRSTRAELERAQLIGYCEPFYQVLELPAGRQVDTHCQAATPAPTQRPATQDEIDQIVATALQRPQR